MRGDANDVKNDLAVLLARPGFRAALVAACAEKQTGFLPPLPVTVYREERLSHVVFPMCELIAYRTTYVHQDVVKAADVFIGARWTAVAKDERSVTRYIEALVRATVDLLWGVSLPRCNSGPILVTEEDYSPLVPS